jgi:hypothetical protein
LGSSEGRGLLQLGANHGFSETFTVSMVISLPKLRCESLDSRRIFCRQERFLAGSIEPLCHFRMPPQVIHKFIGDDGAR